MNQPETIEQLVAERRGYKYLKADGSSPYKGFIYDLKDKKNLTTNLDTDVNKDCGEGWNLATLQWILNDTNIMDKIIVEFSIPEKARIIVPLNSNGKFRTDIIRLKKVHKIDGLFPALKDIQKRLKKYKPTNPITAEKMPSKNKIKKIMAQVWDQVRAQVRAQVGDQVWDQVRAQVGDQVWAQVGDQVWDQVRAQVRDQVWDQVRDQVWDQVWDQVRDQVWDQVRDQVRAQARVCAYYAIKLFMGLPYEHPAFDLIRLGIMVVNVLGKYKVFGKNGKYLGEFE